MLRETENGLTDFQHWVEQEIEFEDYENESL